MLNKVLVIEDNEEILDTRIEFLTIYGIKQERIIGSTDPIDALDLFNKDKYSIDLVICDFYMPNSNGLELCEMMKSNSPDLMIIIQSADLNLNIENVKVADSILYKPFKYEKFKIAIDSVIESKKD